MASGAQIALVSVMLLLSVAFRAATATDHIVGSESGWKVPTSALDYEIWANTTNFVVGDSLVFIYTPQFHTVLAVTGPAFASCNTSEPLGEWKDGKTTVKLEQAGRMWFICGISNHCSKGQRFKVTVRAATGPAAGPASPDSPASDPDSGGASASIKASKAVVILVSLIAGICLL